MHAPQRSPAANPAIGAGNEPPGRAVDDTEQQGISRRKQHTGDTNCNKHSCVHHGLVCV